MDVTDCICSIDELVKVSKDVTDVVGIDLLDDKVGDDRVVESIGVSRIVEKNVELKIYVVAREVTVRHDDTAMVDGYCDRMDIIVVINVHMVVKGMSLDEDIADYDTVW